MGERSLKERLRELNPAKGRLGEPEMIPQSGEPSLKDRLERLVAAAVSRGRDGVTTGSSIEEFVQGHRVENECGEFFLMESDAHLDSYHGRVSLSGLRAVPPEGVGVLAGVREFHSFVPVEAAFLDIETTGLAGGTGTAAFMVGMGFVDGERFRVRQYFMRDYQEEAALLRGLAKDLGRFRYLVTFNGRMFDIPVLETRFQLNKETFPLSGVLHLDLLPPSRRLWKARLESCRLQSLEAAVLGLRRSGDVGGSEIPRLYFEYLRGRRAHALAKVFEHNRLDVVSLAALCQIACRWVEESRAQDPKDVLSLARVLERAELHDRSETEYRRALASGAEAVRLPCLVSLAYRAKRKGHHTEALELWRAAAEAGYGGAFRELAIHHEHRRQDPATALKIVQRGLQHLHSRVEPTSRRWIAELNHRRRRLVRKVLTISEEEDATRATARGSRPPESPQGPG